MSRIGKAPITIPQGVTVDINNQTVLVKGKLGELCYTLCDGVHVAQEENTLVVTRENDERNVRALHGLSRALIQNMVTGVSEGYTKALQLFGTGYAAEVIGPWLKLAVGYSHEILIQVPNGITVSTEAVPRSKSGGKVSMQSIIRVSGRSKEDVGKFSAEIRRVRPPENYKGKGIRYENENVRIKAGKSGAK